MTIDSHEVVPKAKPRRAGCLLWLLRIVAALIALGIVLYLIEEWHGRAAWHNAQADLVKAGISLDPATYIPAPVPDDQNFAALPVFQLADDPKQPGRRDFFALKKAVAILDQTSFSKEDGAKPGRLPYLGQWNRGETPDLAEAKRKLTELCAEAKPPIPVLDSAKPSEIFGLLAPALSDLRSGNAQRPLCVWGFGYDQPTPLFWTTLQMIQHINLAKLLAYQERLALYDDPQLALDDLAVQWKIAIGLQKQPFITATLIAHGVVAIQEGVIIEGLADHVWSDSQLARLDADLGKIDFLANAQFSTRGDFAVYVLPVQLRYMRNRSLALQDSRLAAFQFNMKLTPADEWRVWGDWALSPDGAIYGGLASWARYDVLGMNAMIDLTSRRVYPEKEPKFPSHNPDAKGFLATVRESYYQTFYQPLESRLLTLRKSAYAQTHLDEARIACRLERYRLAHGVYPDTLDALVPLYGPLPHDIMDGENYHYWNEGDGKYVLYSVGWNQKDDGGHFDRRYEFDNAPDWIWSSSPQNLPSSTH